MESKGLDEWKVLNKMNKMLFRVGFRLEFGVL